MLYVVVEASFDYNDEVYSTLEGDPGDPVIGYKDKKKAEAECERRTIQWLRNCHNLWEYGYDPESVVTDVKALEDLLGLDMTVKECKNTLCKGRKFKKDEKFCPQCGSKRGRNVQVTDSDLSFAGYSDDVLKGVAKILNFAPFKVVPIEQGD